MNDATNTAYPIDWGRLSARIRSAYEWVDAADEIGLLLGLRGEDIADYCRECAANAAKHDEDITEEDIESLWCVLDEAAWRWSNEQGLDRPLGR